MNRPNYHIETIINGVLCSQFCNNYACAVAYCEKVETENNAKTRITDANTNKILRQYGAF